MSRYPKIIVVLGPTASGKSALAVKIAKKFNGEIISADSRQIYRGMDIGTAKPTKKEFSRIFHYLIDVKNPDQNYTAVDYKQDAIKAIKKVIGKNKLPILIGGTGLYIKAVIDNLEIPDVKPDQKLREKLDEEIKKCGLKHVFEKLVDLDPEAVYIVDPNNPRRVIRALEIVLKTKKSFSAQRQAGKPMLDFLEIGLDVPKKELDKRIDKRVDLMIRAGLLKEVEKLVKKYGTKQQSFDAIGYREIIGFLNNLCYSNDRKNRIAIKQTTELIKRNTRNYAKRQMTWFKKDKRIHWVKNQKQAEKLVKKFLI